MKSLTKLFCQLTITHLPDQFIIRGRLLHWTSLLFVFLWFTLGFSLLFSGEFIVWLLSGFLALAMSFSVALGFRFEIKIDRNFVLIRYLFVNIPFKRIKSATKDLIISYKDAENLTIISKRKDYYAEDIKDNLRFSYIIPWDGDDWEFYIDYQNKEIDFEVCGREKIWPAIIKGLGNLEPKSKT